MMISVHVKPRHIYGASFAAAAFFVVTLACGCARGGLTTTTAKGTPPSVSDNDLLEASRSSDWLIYGHGYDNDRFTRLSQISVSNVPRLAPAYVFQTGVIDAFETSPLVADGVMYLTGPAGRVFAINAKTGQLIWRWSPIIEPTRLCCGLVNRGVALGHDRIFVGTIDGKLVALDQRSGRQRWVRRVVDSTEGYSITMAPIAFKNAVIVGVAGGEFGIRGFLSAYSAIDGRLLWRWYATSPASWAHHFSSTTSDGSPLHRNLKDERLSFRRYENAWKRGGGALWTTPAIDPSRNTIYATTGNPWPDYLPSRRPGDNLYTDSIVALDGSTGRLKWYFQEVPHDSWDWDVSSPAFLFDTVDGTGKRVSALGEAGKTGWLYVLNRDTGALIRRSQPFVPQSNMFAPPTAKGVRILPGPGGGSNWSPVSYDPDTGLAIVTAINSLTLYLSPHAQRTSGWTGVRVESAGTQSFGLVSAIDVNTGRILWQDRADQPVIGGSATTAGGLTFFGESNGYFDALDTKTGKLLWQFQTGAGVNAPPIVFSVDGKEYVAVASGGNNRISSPLGDALFVFSLP